MHQTSQVGLPCAKFEVEVVLAIALVRGGGAPCFRCRLRKSNGRLYGERHAEQEKNDSDCRGTHEAAPFEDPAVPAIRSRTCAPVPHEVTNVIQWPNPEFV